MIKVINNCMTKTNEKTKKIQQIHKTIEFEKGNLHQDLRVPFLVQKHHNKRGIMSNLNYV